LSELWGTTRVSKPRFVSSFLMILTQWRRGDSLALHHRRARQDHLRQCQLRSVPQIHPRAKAA